MFNCIFCKINFGIIQVNKVYENKFVLAFKDKQPKAPIHILVIPKKHIINLNMVKKKDIWLLGILQFSIVTIVNKYPDMKKGYRVINNCGINGGQTIFHLHYHILGGKIFTGLMNN